MASEESGDYKPLTEEEEFCLEGCGSYPQYHLMRKNFENGHCVFCNLDRERNVVLWEDDNFMLWKIPANIGKKRPLEHHILIVPKRHVRFVADLTDAEAVSLIAANRFAREKLGYGSGLNHAREGDMRNNAGTVPHLHFNLFQPNGTAEVRVPVFKDPRDRDKNQERASRFAEHYQNGMTPEAFENYVRRDLLTEDGRLVSPL